MILGKKKPSVLYEYSVIILQFCSTSPSDSLVPSFEITSSELYFPKEISNFSMGPGTCLNDEYESCRENGLKISQDLQETETQSIS